MALELSKQAFELCVNADSSALRAHLDAHPGIDVYLYEKEGYFNIMGVAAHHESTECLQVLLDFKADVNNRDREMGATAIHAAAGFGRVDSMRLLLEKNADVALVSKIGDTGLIHAAWKGHSECLNLLIEAKADVNHQNNTGTSSDLQYSIHGMRARVSCA
jgi:ankyrin repeat protein